MGNLFQGPNDLAFWRRINRELYKNFMALVAIYIYDRNTGDRLYGENLDKTFGNFSPQAEPTYYVEGYFPELPEWEAKGTKFGLDEKRGFKGYFFYDSFKELTPPQQPPKTGDHLVVQGERYKVMQFNPGDYFVNTQIPLTFSVTLERVRPESITTKPREETEDQMYPVSRLGRSE